MQASSVNILDLFDCVSQLGSCRIEPKIPPHSISARQVKWDIPPLQEYMADQIVNRDTKLTPLLEGFLKQISSPPLYSILLARALFHANVEAIETILTLWPWEHLIAVGHPVLQMFATGNIPSRVTSTVNELSTIFVRLASQGKIRTLRSVDVSACQVLNHCGIQHLLDAGTPCQKNSENHKRCKRFCLCIQYYNPLIVRNVGEKYIAIDRRLYPSIPWKLQNEVSLGEKSCLTIVNARGHLSNKLRHTEVNIHKSEDIRYLRKLDLIVKANCEIGYLLNACHGPLSHLDNISSLRITFFCEGSRNMFFGNLNSFLIGLKKLSIRCQDVLPEHFTALLDSKHASTLTSFELKECDLEKNNDCCKELLKFLDKIAPSLEALYITDCNIQTPFVSGLLKSLQAAIHLVLLYISSNREISPHAFSDAANLGALPEFMFLCITLSSNTVTSELNLSKSLNEYRVKQSKSGYHRKINVVTDLTNDGHNSKWTDDDDSDWEVEHEENDN